MAAAEKCRGWKTAMWNRPEPEATRGGMGASHGPGVYAGAGGFGHGRRGGRLSPSPASRPRSIQPVFVTPRASLWHKGPALARPDTAAFVGWIGLRCPHLRHPRVEEAFDGSVVDDGNAGATSEFLRGGLLFPGRDWRASAMTSASPQPVGSTQAAKKARVKAKSPSARDRSRRHRRSRPDRARPPCSPWWPPVPSGSTSPSSISTLPAAAMPNRTVFSPSRRLAPMPVR